MNKEIVRWIKIVVLTTLREKNLAKMDIPTLISCGMLGYAQALKRYDPTRGVKFKTFAEYRIKGAVLDEVRKMIGDERCKNPRPRRIEDFNYDLISDNGHTQNTIESLLDFETFLNLVPLTERELKILDCRINGMNLREIARQFNFSESRASQLLAKIKKIIFVWYREEMGLKFGLIIRLCPSCNNENCLSDKIQEFRCDICDVPLIMVEGVPVLTQSESETNEYSRNRVYS